MGWLIALGVVIVLAILPLGVSVKYNEEGPQVWIIAGPARIKVFPLKKKPPEDKTKKEKKKKPEPAPAENKETVPAPEPKSKAKPAKDKEKGGKLTDFLPLVKVALDFLGDFRRKLRVNYLILNLTMAGGDPCDLAVNYGRANAALAGLMTQLERLFIIKKRDVRVNCDFTADATTIVARLDLTITLGRIISLLVWYGIRALRTSLKIKKQQEGGADL